MPKQPKQTKERRYKRGDKVRLLDGAFESYSPANRAEVLAAAGVCTVKSVCNASLGPPDEHIQDVTLAGPLEPYLFMSCDMEPA